MNHPESSEIKRLLIAEWEDQCELVGPQTLDEIVSVAESGGDERQFRAAEGGANFSAPEVLKLLIEGATLVRICIGIWKDWKGSPKKPDKTAFIKQVLASGASALPPTIQEHIEALFDRLQQ